VEIERFKTDQLLLKETAAQIQKDFASCGLEIHFTGEEVFPYEMLLKQVTQHISGLVRTNFVQLQTLLYRIDIPEKVFLKLKQSPYFADEMGKIILEREFFKVVSRHRYKP
jgi:hypothetical protein